MGGGDASWTGSFVAKHIRKHDNVVSLEELRPQVLSVVLKEGLTVFVGTVAALKVDSASIQTLLDLGFDLEFIANVPKESFWTGDAIRLVERHRCAFGGLGDLNRALSTTSPRDYVFREYDFIERGLRQHTAVTNFERLADRKYLVHRALHRDVSVVFLDAYDMTADHVRTAYERYGNFDHIIRSNPNGRATSQAITAAQSMGASILGWGQLLGRLNQE